MPPANRLRWALLAIPMVPPLAVVAVLSLGFDPVAHEGSRELIHREDGFVGASTCRPCHLDHFESWGRTFHRTMTQRPTQEAVRGVFDGRPVRYMGREARPIRRGDRFLMELPTGDSEVRLAEVALAVGSRRYQQYFERIEMSDGIAYRRLPLLWHIGAGRWLHLNTVFVGPDDPDWGKHRALWNDNCIFCHTTGPRPGELFRVSPAGERQFDPQVAELGIACESCHGPGREHVERHRGLVARYAAYTAGEGRGIVNPQDLGKEEAVSVCGQCHGQQTPPDVPTLVGWLKTGPTFRSGERLIDHTIPVRRDTPSPSDRYPELFERRFWADGTPRLTAYEYQGITRSPCYLRGEMTCGSCHEMHAGDPRGMIEPAMRGNAACAGCHGDLARDLAAHTKHELDGSGSDCMACHMPRMVYGILDVHRSHRIENPDPRRDGEAGRPHACTLCHMDRSLAWSAAEMERLWGGGAAPPAFRADGAPVDAPDGLASILAGDAVQRVVYARAAGRRDGPLRPEDKAELRMALLATLGDAYPSVRWTARLSLLSLEEELPLGLVPELEAWDHLDPERREIFDSLTLRLAAAAPGRLQLPAPGGIVNADFTPDLQAIVDLLRRQDDHVLDIGE